MRLYSIRKFETSTYFIFGTYQKEPLHVFEGSETIYRKAHLNMTRTATRLILTRNLTNPLAAGVRSITIIINKFNNNNGGRTRNSQERQKDREGLYSQERGDARLREQEQSPPVTNQSVKESSSHPRRNMRNKNEQWINTLGGEKGSSRRPKGGPQSNRFFSDVSQRRRNAQQERTPRSELSTTSTILIKQEKVQ